MSISLEIKSFVSEKKEASHEQKNIPYLSTFLVGRYSYLKSISPL